MTFSCYGTLETACAITITIYIPFTSPTSKQ